MTGFRFFSLLPIIDALHSKTSGDGEARLYRHRFAASLIAGVMFAISIFMLAAKCYLPLNESAVIVLRVFFLFVASGSLLSVYVLRSFGQRIMATNIFLACLGIALIYLAFMTGGILSPVAIFLIFLPAVATLAIDSLAGKIWGLLAFLSWTLLFCAPYMGIEIPRTMREVDDSLFYYICILITHVFIGFLVFYYDGTSKILREALLNDKRDFRYLANYDTQTGVVNRRHFLELLKSEIVMSEKNVNSFCLFFIDLNDFKKANDEFGHHFGDEILEVFSHRLRQRVRATDTVARVGGDEFCIISRNMRNEEDAQKGVGRFETMIKEPLKLKEANYVLKASIGWAIYPTHATDYEALLKYADQHMYQAKRRGKTARTE